MAPAGGEVDGVPADNSELGKRVGALETHHVLIQKQSQETNQHVAGMQRPLAEMREAVKEAIERISANEQAVASITAAR